MPDEKSLFQTAGPSWSERASIGGLQAILMQPNMRRNLFLHGVNTFGAERALTYFPRDGRIIDFGCGTGRFAKFFALRHRQVLATEVTPEMLEQAKKECTESRCEFVLTDGVSLPAASESVNGIWCCGVLRYSLFVPNPAYAEIAKEMYRVLRPGAYVVNCEMYVDVLPDVFLPGFEAAGFETHKVSVLHRYGRRLERTLSHRLIPERWMMRSASISAFVRSQLDNPRGHVPGLRDYLFVWQKPIHVHVDLSEQPGI
jgi:ubiquinone/menaquinone biosynthesis C-methylase UbiE